MQEFIASLQGGTHKGVRGAAHCQSLFIGQPKDLFCVGQRQGKRFFAEKMFTGKQDLTVDLCVKLRRSEIDHDLDLVRGEQFVHGTACRDIVFCGMFFGKSRVDVCACADIQFIIESLDIPDIRVADHAASDNTDLCLLHR